MTGTAGKPISTAAALEAWQSHRHFKYRACAPDPSNPRVLAARPDLSVNTHVPADRDGAEPQAERVAREQAAVELCLGCPVMVLCDAYATSVTPDGRLAQPDGVWGGRLARERRAAFAESRHEVTVAAPDSQLRTDQKQDVLLALAMCADGDAESVAAAAGVDVRTANWQRSRLVTQLNLVKGKATRAQLLAEAVRRGLLDASLVVVDDGQVLAVPVSVKSGKPMQLGLWPAKRSSAVGRAAGRRPVGRGPRPVSLRSRFTAVPGQGDLAVAGSGLADVRSLFPATRLEAAA
ncbi:WhiB family transcriptional regulator [Streptomyces sp. NPDC059582]|uniref:WhiB family transcriptional regulator n=1 Tax=Streptomyces sp. NPDC059582 TaxID=3346875 RepID=UPI0036C239A4